MRIMYIHHANRKKGNPPTQEDGITSVGKRDAVLVSKMIGEYGSNGAKFRAIYTSPFKRCLKTAKIINKRLGVEIVEEPRFNEFRSVKDETWLDLQNRVRDALHDIVSKYNGDDIVVCVTSGVNVVAFMQLALKVKPSENAPFIGLPSCSPMVFVINKENFN